MAKKKTFKVSYTERIEAGLLKLQLAPTLDTATFANVLADLLLAAWNAPVDSKLYSAAMAVEKHLGLV